MEGMSAQHASRCWRVVMYDFFVPEYKYFPARCFQMHDQTPYRDSLPVRDAALMLPVRRLFVEYGEAESVELEESQY